MTQPSRTPTQITDSSGRTVAANVRRVRESRGWSTYELAQRLKEADRPISPSAVAKIERGERRVDVGDLMALAVALAVSPSALLLPINVDPLDDVEITGSTPVSALDAWEWIDGRGPLTLPPQSAGMHRVYEEVAQYRLYGRPHWLAEMEREEDEGREPRTRASRMMRAAGLESYEAEDGKRRIRRRQDEGRSDGPSMD
ncbi:helix-turn-helix domain-containing protein [Streptomyces sp. NPDC058254]|uniref:helix-turn-helix domain-containing protein n=1 Tax=Streptomyces sp. NPDC058254 TaxID=3346406 RepID=UPI0036E422A2